MSASPASREPAPYGCCCSRPLRRRRSGARPTGGCRFCRGDRAVRPSRTEYRYHYLARRHLSGRRASGSLTRHRVGSDVGTGTRRNDGASWRHQSRRARQRPHRRGDGVAKRLNLMAASTSCASTKVDVHTSRQLGNVRRDRRASSRNQLSTFREVSRFAQFLTGTNRNGGTSPTATRSGVGD
jgi:hypothetical protein